MGRILVVEDDRSVAAIVSAALMRDGHLVHTVNSYEEAIMVPARAFDVMFLDYSLPNDRTGLELVDWFPGVPYIIMSGYPKADVAPDCPFLRKPFTVEEVRVEAAKLLSKYEIDRKDDAYRRGDSEPEATP